MALTFALTVNGSSSQVRCEPGTPLLYVLRNDLGLNGPKFGCGVGRCGSCMVTVAGKARRSCVLPVEAIKDQAIVTLEGLASDGRLHPVQDAFLEEQAAQCAYCSNGMIMTAVALLAVNGNPSEDEVREALDRNLCRCGIHNRIVKAVMRAANGAGR